MSCGVLWFVVLYLGGSSAHVSGVRLSVVKGACLIMLVLISILPMYDDMPQDPRHLDHFYSRTRVFK